MNVPQATKSVLRPAGLLMAGRFVAFGITALIPILLVRVLSQQEFGTYKQVFLISSTIYFIAQFGVATSLFYFLPKAARAGGRYVGNAITFLGGVGVLAMLALALGRVPVAQALNNPLLAPYLPLAGAYTALLIVTVILEIVMICRGQYLHASAAYALSDGLRAVCFLLPVLLGLGLKALLVGGIAAGGIRLAAMLVYLKREYGDDLGPDAGLFKDQLGYALPFGSAVVLEILVNNFHHYFVSSRFDAATFAIYAAGCLQIPFIDFVAVPTGDVMMVKMREALASDDAPGALAIWHDTTRKLASLFFPVVGLSLVVAHELIVTLYTSAYAASAPIFMAWSLAILFTAIPVDGVMRVFAQTRFLLLNNLVKLCLTVALVSWFVGRFQLVGAVLITLLSTFVARSACLIRLRRLMGIPWGQVLPYGSLAAVAGAAALSAIPASLVKNGFDGAPAAALVASSLAYAASYGALVLGARLLSVSQRVPTPDVLAS